MIASLGSSEEWGSGKDRQGKVIGTLLGAPSLNQARGPGKRSKKEAELGEFSKPESLEVVSSKELSRRKKGGGDSRKEGGKRKKGVETGKPLASNRLPSSGKGIGGK